MVFLIFLVMQVTLWFTGKLVFLSLMIDSLYSSTPVSPNLLLNLDLNMNSNP